MFKDGILFDSTEEFRFYTELKELEKNGLVSDIEVHKEFVLIPQFTNNNNQKVKQMTYIADFVFNDIQLGRKRVVDIKGFIEEHFKIKAKLFEYLYCNQQKDSAFTHLELLSYRKYAGGFVNTKELTKLSKTHKKEIDLKRINELENKNKLTKIEKERLEQLKITYRTTLEKLAREQRKKERKNAKDKR